MSRRKQIHPKHIESEHQLASWLKNGGHFLQTLNAAELSGSDEDGGRFGPDGGDILTDDEHVCGKCRAQFPGLSDFLLHKKLCARRRLVLVVATDRFEDPNYASELEPQREPTEEEEPGRSSRIVTDMSDDKIITEASPRERERLSPPRLIALTRQETALNLSRLPKDDAREKNAVAAATSGVSRASNLPQPHYSLLPDTHVALETLQNTRVAVAQHGHNARATELGALQTALYTLQQQQLLQLQIIQQLHAHILGNAGAPPTPVTTALAPALACLLPPAAVPTRASPLLTATTPLTRTTDVPAAAMANQPSSSLSSSSVHRANKPTTSALPAMAAMIIATTTPEKDKSITSPLVALPTKREKEDSPGLTAIPTLAQPLSLPPPPPLPQEPNTLELLQRHTEQALQNTMSGGSFLLNGINGLGGCDSLRLKKKSEDGKEEALFRHRCKFCGKVFGSDSALQIHLRSHTGERPFKCNVCGNRFSTKGNLKVHFQRHKAKYPHVKMNPNPVPEHLDALHPPLEPPNSSTAPGSPSSSNMMTMLASTNSNCSNASNSLINVSEPERSSTPQLAEDLSIRASRNESSPAGADITVQCHPSLLDRSRSDSLNDVSNLTAASEDNTSLDGSVEANVKLERDLDHLDDSMVSSGLGPGSPAMKDDDDDDDDMMLDDYDDDDIPREDEIKRSVSAEPYYNPNRMSSYSPFMHSSGPTFPSFFQNSPFTGALTMSPFTFGLNTTANNNSGTTATTAAAGGEGAEGEPNNPALYQDLLPKPGSVDSNWETLMEVTKTSETSKLQQLVDNIEHKLSDPNQCIICHRVLSCKSALQMHYRTHTGERPFKCKICGRAFTTKGNLKTHMGVHRVKPPLRVLHQCPVCHKQFTNSLVLQQHIRMHTGSRSELLSRGEVKIPSMPLLQPSFHRSSLGMSQTHNSQAGILMSPPPPSARLALLDLNRRKSCSPVSLVFRSPLPGSPDSVVKDASSAKVEKMDESESPERLPSPAPSNRSGGQSPPPLTPAVVKEETVSPPFPALSLVATANSSQHHRGESPTRALSPGFDKMTSGHPTFTTSLAALENHVKTINTAIPQPLPFGPFGIALPVSGYQRYDDPSCFGGRPHPLELSTGSKSPAQSSAYSSSPATSRAASEGSADDRLTPGGGLAVSGSPLSVSMSSMVSPSSNVLSSARSESGALDLTPRASVLAGHASSNHGSGHNERDMIVSPRMFPSPLGGLPFPPTPGRSNTTCQICFKTFACNSALEIHYRSHTKERPFKCHVCDRGFSTKGNMKQHMLTHKIRDLPSQLFTTTTTPPTPTSTDSRGSVNHEDSQNDSSVSNTLKELENLKRQAARDHHHHGGGHHHQHHHHHHQQHGGGGGHHHHHHHHQSSNPVPKRPPGMPKHMCHVCNKPFSSGSALQIHMRTHTGDKPFKCSICGRAFTTKGNLKVHMGTHMWSNGSSRRGRRMSLELPPLPLPPGAKPGDLVHHRPDLYFQYFNPAYLNGMTPPPKMNEISVIQSAAGLSNGGGGIPLSVHQQHVMNQMMSNHRPLPPNNGNGVSEAANNRTSASSTPDSSKNGNDYRLSSESKRSSSPPRGERSSPASQRHTPTSIGALQQHPPTSIGPNWGWKIACNVCNKICVSSTELEIHLKTHYKNQDERRDTKSSPENLKLSV